MLVHEAGFTLLELLIAAALVGVLTMFATVAFRQTASDIRVENAKRSADIIAAAIYRFKIAYGHDFDTVGDLDVGVAPAGECNPNSLLHPLQTLINCGFLAYRQYWNPDEFYFSVNGTRVTVHSQGNPRIKYAKDAAVYETSEGGFVQQGYST